MSNLYYAIRYAELGFHIFPCEPNSKDPLAGLMGGFRNATRDEGQIRKWWKATPTANIGFYPGASGLIVLDVDVKDGGMGMEQLEALEFAHFALPDAPVSITPSKGRHLLFSKGSEFEDGVVITNTKLADDIDIRSDNGYILLEPSITPDGAYSFIDWDVLVDEAPSFPAVPDWVLDVQAKRIVAAGHGDASDLDPISTAPALSDEVLNRFKSLLGKSTKIRKRYKGSTEGLRDTSGSGMDMSMASILKAVGFSYLETVALLSKWPHGSKSPDRNKDRYWQRIWTRSLVKEFDVSKFDEANPSDIIVDNLLSQLPTQDNVALVIAHRYGEKMVFSHRINKWLSWSGKLWEADNTKSAYHLCRTISRSMNREGKAAMASSNFAAGVETFCRADPVFSRVGDEFDRDNYLLNTPSGVVDLRTGQIRDSVPDDYLTKMTSVSPSREGGEVFLKFMDQITLGDQELIEFHQVSLGACLSGAMEAHWMLFWIGAGRNGKNTLGDLIQYIYGDYAKKILSSVLMSKTHEAHPAEIAQLDGCRLATSSEVDEGSFWHESKINELTGDATLSARFMNQNFFEFVRTHKHLIYGNHRPQLRSVTPAIRSRIKIVPFPASFIGREDATLPTKLKACAPFVLQWLIDGHTKWLAAGRKLPSCQSIERESDDYFSNQSTVELWISENLEQRLEVSEKAGKLYENYRHWKLDRGESPVSATRWGETMGKKFRKIKNNSVHYENVRIKIEWEEYSKDIL